MQFNSQDSTGRLVQHDGRLRTHALLVGETLTVSSATPIEKIELVPRDGMPGGGLPQVDGKTISFDLPGRYEFRVFHSGGAYDWLRVCAAEPECFAKFDTAGDAYARSGGAPVDHRAMLDALGNRAAWFDGRAKSTHGRGLREFGA